MFRPPVFACSALLVLTACSQSPLTPPRDERAPQAASRPTGMAVAGRWRLTVRGDQVALEPIRDAQTSLQQNLFHLDIARFLRPSDLQVRGVQFDPDGNVQVNYAIRHPFAAPDLTLPPSGKNRSDLGFTGQLLILTDVDASEVPAQTFFPGVTVNTTAVLDADGYLKPGDLLRRDITQNATAFPYKLVADDGRNNREGVSNGGNDTGNYDAAQGGWQRFNIDNGGVNNNWTGYDFLHQGQTATGSFTLARDEVNQPGGLSCELAVIIKYQDPRGTLPAVDPFVRFPQDQPADPHRFAYRLPYAALDVSRAVPGSAGGRLTTAAGSQGSLEFFVRDWDARAVESPNGNVGDDSDLSHIQQGAAGVPTIVAVVPALSDSTFTASEFGSSSGHPSDPLQFLINLRNDKGTALAGVLLPGLAQVTDPEQAIADRGGYTFGVDPEFLTPDPSRALTVTTYAAITASVDALATGYADNLPGTYTNGDPTNTIGNYDARQQHIGPGIAIAGPAIYHFTNDLGVSSTGRVRLNVSPDLGATWSGAQSVPATGPVGFDRDDLRAGGVIALADGSALVLVRDNIGTALSENVFLIRATAGPGGTLTWDPQWTLLSGRLLDNNLRAVGGDLYPHPSEPSRAYAAIAHAYVGLPSRSYLEAFELNIAGGLITATSLGEAQALLDDSNALEPQIAAQSDGSVHVAWRYNTTDVIRYNKLPNGGAWSTNPETPDPFYDADNRLLELELNGVGVPYVLYAKDININSRPQTFLARRDLAAPPPSAWSQFEVDPSSQYGADSQAAMDIDPETGAIYVVSSREGDEDTDPDTLVYGIFPANLGTPILPLTVINPAPGSDTGFPWIGFTRAPGNPLSVVLFEGRDTPTHHEVSVLRITD